MKFAQTPPKKVAYSRNFFAAVQFAAASSNWVYPGGVAFANLANRVLFQAGKEFLR